MDEINGIYFSLGEEFINFSDFDEKPFHFEGLSKIKSIDGTDTYKAFIDNEW